MTTSSDIIGTKRGDLILIELRETPVTFVVLEEFNLIVYKFSTDVYCEPIDKKKNSSLSKRKRMTVIRTEAPLFAT